MSSSALDEKIKEVGQVKNYIQNNCRPSELVRLLLSFPQVLQLQLGSCRLASVIKEGYEIHRKEMVNLHPKTTH